MNESPTGRFLFAVEPNYSGPPAEAYVRVNAREADLKEDWYRDSIASNPELVISACRSAGLTQEDWYYWGTEVPVSDIGSIDVLLVSKTGRVCIVETKLAYNPEKRRSVVAQVLDYAVNLADHDLDQMPELPSKDGKPLVEPNKVQHGLRQGDYLLIVAGDEIDPRAVRLTQAMLGEHVLHKWDLALVEVALYKRQKEENIPAWLVGPTLRGTLCAETRQVFEIKIVGLPDNVKTTVTHITADPVRPDSRGKWDRGTFIAALEASSSVPAGFKKLGVHLLQIADDHPGELEARFGTSKYGSFGLKRNGYGLLEFNLSGYLCYRPDKIAEGLPAPLANEYLAKFLALLGTTPGKYTSEIPAAVAAQKCDELIALIEETLAKANEAEATISAGA